MRLRILHEADSALHRRNMERRTTTPKLPGDSTEYFRDFVDQFDSFDDPRIAQMVCNAKRILADLDGHDSPGGNDGDLVISEVPAVVGTVAKAAASELAAKGASALTDKALGSGNSSG